MEHSESVVSEHIGRFTALERDVSTLNGRVTTMEADVGRLVEDFYNHGQDGFKTKLTKFMAVYEEREESRDKAWRNFRWLVGSFIALLAIMATVYVGLKTNEQIQHNLIHVPQIFAPNKTGQIYSAHNKQLQDAGIPPIANGGK